MSTSVFLYLLVVSAGIASAVAAALSGFNPMAFSLSLFAVALTAGLVVESFAAYRPVRDRAPYRRVEWANSLCNLLLGFAVGGAIYAGLRWALKAGLGVNPGFASSKLGPLWMQALLAFLIMDLARYLVHFAQHRVPLLWELHKTHHTIQEVRLANVLFAHPADYVPRLVFPVYLPMAVGMMPSAVLIAQAGVTILGLLSHISAAPRFGALNWVFATSEVHRWHHNVVPERGGDRNFGIGTILWDRLFGTFYQEPHNEAPEQLGIDITAPTSFIQTISLNAHRVALRREEQLAGTEAASPELAS